MLLLDLFTGKKVVRVCKDAGGKLVWKTFPRWPHLNKYGSENLVEVLQAYAAIKMRNPDLENKDNEVCRDAWYSRYIYITWGPYHLM